MDLSSSGSLAMASCPEQNPTPTENGVKWPNGGAYPDITICYAYPAGVTANDPRRGEYMDIEAWYHLQVFIPLLQQFLPDDPKNGAPWIRIPARITVIIN